MTSCDFQQQVPLFHRSADLQHLRLTCSVVPAPSRGRSLAQLRGTSLPSFEGSQPKPFPGVELFLLPVTTLGKVESWDIPMMIKMTMAGQITAWDEQNVIHLGFQPSPALPVSDVSSHPLSPWPGQPPMRPRGPNARLPGHQLRLDVLEDHLLPKPVGHSHALATLQVLQNLLEGVDARHITPSSSSSSTLVSLFPDSFPDRICLIGFCTSEGQPLDLLKVVE